MFIQNNYLSIQKDFLMSITFYVQDWHKQPTVEEKVPASVIIGSTDFEYINFVCENDPFFFKENGQWFENKTIEIDPFPSVNISNCFQSLFFKLSGIDSSSEGGIEIEDLDFVIQKIHSTLSDIKLIKSNEIETIQEKNMTYCGIGSERISEKLTDLLNLFVFAKNNNKSVYWG